jgi:uncharacterized protein YdaU (DUF1376 family)
MNYYQHHIGDFIRDTSRLSDSQCMAYIRMIWMYYESEQPLPNNLRTIAFKVGADEETIGLILDSFFKLDGDVWRQTRCDQEINEYRTICVRNKTNGKAGGRPKKTQSVSSGIPVDSQPEPHRNPNQYPVTSNQVIDKSITDDKPKTVRRKTQYPSDFYPNETGQAAAGAKGIDIAKELEKFRDWHIAKGNTMADWQAAWRTWVGNARPTFQPRQAESFAERDERMMQDKVAAFTGRRPQADIVDITPMQRIAS